MSEEIESRLYRLEEGDRLQARQIRLIQKLQSAFFGALALGFLLSQQAIQEPANRKLLESIAIGVIATSVSGLGLSGFVSPPSGGKDGQQSSD